MLQNLPQQNPDLYKIISLLNQHENVFLTGFAGTGKSYILKQLKKIYKEKLVLTSTTGISAVNVGGQTIHSWAGVGCMEEPVDNLANTLVNATFGSVGKTKMHIKHCELLAIDEISMLSAYQLEYLDKIFRIVRGLDLPFGGIQVIFIGDFLQLPPVATKNDLRNFPRRALFCFQSSIWDDLNIKTVILTKIYRQKNYEFSRILCDFRLGEISEKDMRILSQRFVSDSPKLSDKLHLFPKKEQVHQFNTYKLNKLNTPLFEYKSYDNIPIVDGIDDEYSYKRKIFYELNKNCQAERIINLKVGCRVMLLINLDFKSGLINGSCGTVLELTQSYAIVKFDNGITKKIGKMVFDMQENEISIATRFQLPLKLAYAVTIHKAQGMTFDEIVIDCNDAFSPGQIYVGLSRVKTLNGLYITGFNPKKLYPSSKARYFYLKLESEEMQRFKDELYKRLGFIWDF